ncbi:MAG: hypothetical protein HKP25_04825 [Marinicaulis sp.]|nr:hypothetical protein [Marinicaulis sp.]
MKSRTLTENEWELWRRTTKDVAPMQNGGGDTVTRRSVNPIVRNPAATMKRETLGQHNVFQSGDPRSDRRAGRGRIAIDAELDLHGHTVSTAEATLYGFLLNAKSRKYRCVLVITGKGRGDARSFNNEPPRGVLHRQVRNWINSEPFRQHIARAAPAHRRHGGDGAVYIFLKSSSGRTGS